MAGSGYGYGAVGLVLFRIALCMVTIIAGVSTGLAETATCMGRSNCCNSHGEEEGSCSFPNYNGGRVALVAGSDFYSDAFQGELGDLENAGHDAVMVGDRLAEVGFSVRYVLNPTREDVLSELEALETHMRTQEAIGTTGPEARTVIYVAGHGMSFDFGSGTFEDYLIFRPNAEQAREMQEDLRGQQGQHRPCGAAGFTTCGTTTFCFLF